MRTTDNQTTRKALAIFRVSEGPSKINVSFYETKFGFSDLKTEVIANDQDNKVIVYFAEDSYTVGATLDSEKKVLGIGLPRERSFEGTYVTSIDKEKLTPAQLSILRNLGDFLAADPQRIFEKALNYKNYQGLIDCSTTPYYLSLTLDATIFQGLEEDTLLHHNNGTEVRVSYQKESSLNKIYINPDLGDFCTIDLEFEDLEDGFIPKKTVNHYANLISLAIQKQVDAIPKQKTLYSEIISSELGIQTLWVKQES
jgi:hypothetical protein